MSSSLSSLVDRLAADLDNRYGNGVRAELRRSSTDNPGAAFWRVATEHLEPAGELGGPSPDPERVRRWALVLRAIAELGPLHRPGRSLGEALAAAGVAEMRVIQLLRAHGESLERELRALLMQLTSAGEPVNAVDIAYLVLTDGSDPAQRRTRHRIARSYFASTSSS